LLVYRSVVDGVVARVEEDGCAGDAGRCARDIKRCHTQKHRRDSDTFQDFPSRNRFRPAAPTWHRRIAHRAMVTITLLSSGSSRLICKGTTSGPASERSVFDRGYRPNKITSDLLRVDFVVSGNGAELI
jgi:hypothetical protein